MILKKVKIYLESLELFDDFKVEKLGRGNNSETFLIIVGNTKYVMRVGRGDVSSNNQLFTQYKFLKFLESEDIDFVQRAVYYDKKKKMLITSFLEGDNLIGKKLNKKQFDDLVEKIIKIHSTKYSNFQKFCKKNKFKIDKPISLKDKFKVSGIRRGNFVLKNCDNKEVVEWVRLHLEKAGRKVRGIKENKKFKFTHGDLTGANIMIDKGSILFIDWDAAKFSYLPEYEIAYSIIHYDYFLDHKDEILKRYAKLQRLDFNTFNDKILVIMEIVLTTKVIWAAWIYTKMKKEKIRGANKYYKLFLKRVDEYNKLFK